MPYITDQLKDELKRREALRPGELTYNIYRLCLDYVGERPVFEDIANVLGSLEASKLEFYRRVVVPFETKKIQQNGDVT
jgi:hypothetical protein